MRLLLIAIAALVASGAARTTETDDTTSILSRAVSSINTAAQALGLAEEEEPVEQRSILSRLLSPSKHEEEHVESPSLATRLGTYLTGFKSAMPEIPSVPGMSEELMKATGVSRKSIADYASDLLESLHIKDKSVEKAAAEEVARRLEATGITRSALDDLQLPATAEGKVDALLKMLGLRELSTTDKLKKSYDDALHQFKVAVGSEEPTLAERLQHVFGSARDTVMSLPSDVTDQASSAAAKTAASVLDARDTANYYASKLLGGKESAERKGVVSKARDTVDTATHNVLVALGYESPTMMESLRAYTSTGSLRPTFKTSVSDSAADLLTPTSGGVIDRTLKALHLRDRTAVEKAQAAYDDAMHALKSRVLNIEDRTAAEKVNDALQATNAQVKSALQSLSSALPSSVGGDSHPTEAMKQQYDAAAAKVRSTLTDARRQFEHQLASAGLKDKSTAESIRDSVDSSWHNMMVGLGVHDPTLYERYVQGKKPITESVSLCGNCEGLSSVLCPSCGGIVDRTLKALHLRDRTAVEISRDAYLAQLDRMKKALAGESDTGGLSNAIEDAENSVREATSSFLHMFASSGDKEETMTESARKMLDSVAGRNMQNLLTLRSKLNKAVKSGKLKNKAVMMDLSDASDAAMHAMWTALGYSEPTFYQRVLHSLQEGLHKAKLGAGLESPTAGERLQSMGEATIDAAGNLVGGGPNLAQRIKQTIVG